MRLKINDQDKTAVAYDLFYDCTKDWSELADELIAFANNNKNLKIFLDEKDCIETESFYRLFDKTSNIVAQNPEIVKNVNFNARIFNDSLITSKENKTIVDDEAVNGYSVYSKQVEALNREIENLSGGAYKKVEIFQPYNRVLLAFYNNMNERVVMSAEISSYFTSSEVDEAKLAFDIQAAPKLLFFPPSSNSCFPDALLFQACGDYAISLEVDRGQYALYKSKYAQISDELARFSSNLPNYAKALGFDKQNRVVVKVEEEPLFDALRSGEVAASYRTKWDKWDNVAMPPDWENDLLYFP